MLGNKRRVKKCGRALTAFALALSMLMISAGGLGAAERSSSSEAPPYAEGQVLVRFSPAVARAAAIGQHEEVEVQGIEHIGFIGLDRLWLPEHISVEEAVAFYSSLPGVEYAEPNWLVKAAATIPDDPLFPGQWALNNNTNDADIDAPEAWDLETGDGSVVIAILDTGIDYNHPDLAANIWQNAGEQDCNDSLDDDNNGFVDDCIGWNFVADNNNPLDDDHPGHGTHVAGIAGAIGNNTEGVSGVAWNVRLMPVKFLDSTGSGSVADAIQGIYYAVDNGARVINSSYVHEAPSQAEQDAISYANRRDVLMVAAAGNQGANNDSSTVFPANRRIENIVSVAASTVNDTTASFTNLGPNSVHLSAPGQTITSTLRLGVQGGYGAISGTSMSTPFVSSTAAMLMMNRPFLTTKEVREIILLTGDPVGHPTITGRRLNLDNALRADLRLLSPFQPTHLRGRPLSSTSTKIDWLDNSTIEDGYLIERRPFSMTNYLQVDTVPANTTVYTDTAGLVPDVTYIYRVKATQTANGDSPYSNTASVTTLEDPSVLHPPDNLAATALSSSSIHVTWRDNSNVEESYKLERTSGGADFSELAVLQKNTTFYQDQGLNPDTLYTYRVRAFNSVAGNSGYSNEDSARTAAVQASGSGGGGGGGCFIATAAYGTPLHEDIDVLRRFRDRRLLTNDAGRRLVELYYRTSPPLADWIAERGWARALVRTALTPIVWFAGATATSGPAGAAAAAGAALLAALSAAVMITLGRRRRQSETTGKNPEE